MPDEALIALIPIAAAFLGWALKRIVGSVIDERVTPQIQGLRDELREHMREEDSLTDRLVTEITMVRERVAHIEGAQR